MVKNTPANAGEVGSIPGSGRSPGGGNGNPHQDSCLKNPTERETWWAIVLGVTKSQTQLSHDTATGCWVASMLLWLVDLSPASQVTGRFAGSWMIR